MAHWDTRPIADYDTINQNQPILGANDGGVECSTFRAC